MNGAYEDRGFKKAIYQDGDIFKGQKEYDLGNNYGVRWIDENTFEIFHKDKIMKRVNL